MTMPTVERIETEAGKRYRGPLHALPAVASWYSFYELKSTFRDLPWLPTATPASARSRAELLVS